MKLLTKYLSSRVLIAFICFSPSLIIAQSKKELRAEVEKLNSEIVELKKPVVVNMEDKDAQASYALGVVISSNIKSQGLDSVNVEALVKAIEDVLEDKEVAIEEEEAAAIVQEYVEAAMTRKAEAMEEEGSLFLEENKSRAGVVETESGLQYEVINEGSGKSPEENDQVMVHYVGKLMDGTVFDSSVERGEPVTFGVGQVIPGWTEALQLMQEGDKWIVYIPYNLAYGERGAGGQIPSYATLIFEVELLEVLEEN